MYWETSGEPRVEEKMGNGPPHIAQLGRGIVYSFAGAVDGGVAGDRHQGNNEKPEQGSEEAQSEAEKEEERRKLEQKRRSEGGVFTTAFKSSVLASGEGSMRQGVLQVQDDVKRNNENWEKALKAADKRNKELYEEFRDPQYKVSSQWEAHQEMCRQKPAVGSSHFCRLDYPLFL